MDGKENSNLEWMKSKTRSLYFRALENKTFRKADQINDRIADAMWSSINNLYRWIFKPGGLFGFAHTYSKTFQTFILGSLVSTIILGICIFPENSSTITTTHVLYISTCVALGSFFLNSFTTAKAERKRITVEFVFATREAREYQNAVSVLQECPPWISQKKITWKQYSEWSRAALLAKEEISDKQKDTIAYYRAISFLLNYYEFMSAGLCTDALDEELIHRMMRSFLVNLVSKTEDIIYELRKSESEVNISTGGSLENYDKGKVLCHLVYMFNRWNEEGQELALGPDPVPYVHRDPKISQISYEIKLSNEFAVSDQGQYEAMRNSEVDSQLEALDKTARLDLHSKALKQLEQKYIDEGPMLAGKILAEERKILRKDLEFPDFESWKQNK